jgi:hypothetical protein
LRFAKALLSALAVAFLLVSACFGQTITVRLVNGKNGKPYTHKMLRTSLFNGKIKGVSLLGWSDSVPAPSSGAPGAWIAPGWAKGVLSAGLDSNGVATFDLPKRPLPPTVCARADIPPGTVLPCARNSCFATDLVLDSGVMTGDTCEGKKKIRAQFKPKPGEIILFVRRQTFWDSPPWE